MPIILRPRRNDEDDRAVWPDLSGNGNDGTLTNFAYEPGNRPRTNAELCAHRWHDLSGLGNDADLTNCDYNSSSGWAAAPDRLVLDGVNDHGAVVSPNAAADKSFTYEAWFTTVSDAAVTTWIVAEGHNTNQPYGGLLSYSGRLYFRLHDGTNQSQLYALGPYSDGASHHVVGTCDGSLMRLYVDNVEYDTPVAPPVGSLDMDRAAVGAVRRLAAVGGCFPGSIYIARIYSAALTPAQIAQNFAAGITGADYVRTGLVLDLSAARAVRPSGWSTGAYVEPAYYGGTDYTSATYSLGHGVVALRIDDGSSLDYSYIYPELTSRGLVGGFAVVGDHIGGGGYTSLADLLTMQTNGMEIMCHSQTHGTDPADLAEFTAETVTAAEAMRADGLDIASFVQPGTWSTAWPTGYHLNDNDFWGSTEDLLLRANFSAYEAYIGNAYRTLPIGGNGRYGPPHITADTGFTLAQLTAVVDAVIAAGQGLCVLAHSSLLDVVGHLSTADFESFLDYLETKVASNDLTVLTPTQLLYAVPS